MSSAPALITVHKFGGVALADAAAMLHAAEIVARSGSMPTVVVASAVRGVTDALLGVATRAVNGDGDEARATIEELRRRHAEIATALPLAAPVRSELLAAIDDAFDELIRIAGGLIALRELTPTATDAVLARGERLSTRLLAAALTASGIAAEFVDATRVVYTDHRPGNAFPDFARTERAAEEVLVPLILRGVVPVVPGFIGSGENGATVTLGRGGTDLTATLLARVLHAREVVLWKDVPGILTANPRVVPDARLIPALDVREASELAYYGAKVLHPRALIALGEGTRLFIRPLADPDARGTEISARRARTNGGRSRHPVKALSAIADQALVTVAGNGMVGVPGIAARVFTTLERAGVSISLISQASSEHSICIGMPASAGPTAERHLREAFAAELVRQEIDGIDLRADVATVAVVGLGMAGTPGVAGRLFTALADARINVVAIAQGASELNISVVVEGKDAAAAQCAVHAAFRLDKIGGGTAERVTHSDLVLLGFGQIGRELVAHLGAKREVRHVRVIALIDRSGFVFDPRGLAPKRLAGLAEAKRLGVSLADAPRGKRATAQEALALIGSHALSRPILVDATADDTTPVLELAIAHGMDLVLANKRPLAAAKRAADALVQSAASRGRRILHEATVGAGLPIIDTFHKLVESGDQVLRIEGCPSGTMGYIFGELGRGVTFSEALRGAMKLGYTEPDPRDDLSGMDVARKAIILGRLLGYTGELEDVRVDSLVPEAMCKIPLDEFLKRAEDLDPLWEQRAREAKEKGKVLRYRVTVTKRGASVGVVMVGAASSLAALGGTDNQFSFTTKRYRANPLVITGPGAGPAVTAGGVLNDVLKLAVAR